ncbi:MAG: enoyl-CoA hydratase/isomerase family protein [bacterium]
MDYQTILYTKADGMATITLNRPRQLNALDEQMILEVLDAVKKVAADEEVKVLILTGAGRAFCFGADIGAFQKGANSSAPLAFDLLPKAQEIIRTLVNMNKPTIAALNGFATGLGLDLALACDLRVAAERAKLGEAFITMGLVPDGGGTYFLPRLVGLAKAAELIFTGDALSSAEAERLGLINRVVPTPDLEKNVRELALKLAKSPSPALGLAKRLIWKNLHANLEEALLSEAESQKICLESKDHREAVQAYLEKREPIFGKK